MRYREWEKYEDSYEKPRRTGAPFTFREKNVFRDRGSNQNQERQHLPHNESGKTEAVQQQPQNSLGGTEEP